MRKYLTVTKKYIERKLRDIWVVYMPGTNVQDVTSTEMTLAEVNSALLLLVTALWATVEVLAEKAEVPAPGIDIDGALSDLWPEKG